MTVRIFTRLQSRTEILQDVETVKVSDGFLIVFFKNDSTPPCTINLQHSNQTVEVTDDE